MSSVVVRKQSSISLFTEKLFPEPGVPRIRPLGFLSLDLLALIIFPESVFTP